MYDKTVEKIINIFFMYLETIYINHKNLENFLPSFTN